MTTPPLPPSQQPPAPRTGSRVVVNTASLASASLWRIGVAFVIQVAIARQLGAAALGDYAVVLAWLYVAQVALEAGLPAHTVRHLAGHVERRRAAHGQIQRIQLVLSVVAFAALVVGAYLIPALRPRAALFAIAGLSLPFYALLSAAGTIFEASERMDRVFLVDGLTNAILLAATLAVLRAGGGIPATLAALTAVQVLSALLATWVLRRSRLLAVTEVPEAPPSVPQPSWQTTLREARPFFNLSLADVLQQRADLLLLSAIASPQTIGLYAAANSLVRVLIKVVQAYWRALYPTLSRLRDAQAAAYHTLSDMAQRFVLAMTLPAAAIGATVAAGIVALVFGPGYTEADRALALLLPAASFYAWELRGVTALLADHRPRPALWIAMAHLVATFALIPPLTAFAGASGAGLAATLAAAAGALFATILSRSTSAAPPDRRLLWVLLAALAGGALALLFQRIGLPWWAAAALAALGCLLLLGVTGGISRADIRFFRAAFVPQPR